MAPLLLLTVAWLQVQAPQASVVGTVTDGETGSPLSGAVVALVDQERVVASDSLGRYALADVPPGPQHVTVRALGYSERTLHALVPRSGALTIDVTLRPDPIRLQALDVRPPLELRGVEPGQGAPLADRSITIGAVRNHPLLAEPDVFQAMGGGEVVLMPESPSGVHVRGGASDQTAYLLDGIPVLSPYHATAVFSAWNPDALSHLDLFSTTAAPALADALSGVIAGTTRTPGATMSGQGSFGTNQARAAVDGPLGATGASYLLSWRTGFPGAMSPKDEPSYLRGETGDLLGKVELSTLGGRLRLLGYDSEDELDGAAVAEQEAGRGPPRNTFEWNSRSLGLSWERELSGIDLLVRGWSAAADANSNWGIDFARVRMDSRRRDEGALLLVGWGAAERTSSESRAAVGAPARTTIGVRAQRITTSYSTDALAADLLGSVWDVRTPLLSASIEHRRDLGASLQLGAAASVTRAVEELHVSPRAEVRWSPSQRLTVAASYARLFQFAQSLRNAESAVGNIFPADLYLGAGESGVPVARSDQGVLAADFRPLPGVRATAQAWTRALDGLVLVAPAVGQPFAAGYFLTGSGTARGASLDLSVAGARYGLIASYGWQRLRLAYPDGEYVPEHGSSHTVEGGVIVFPGATWQARFGAAAAWGRRTTAVSGGLEWEACNLLDEGCELAGSPLHTGEPLGGSSLPAYLRVDVGLRKHWHVRVAGRDAMIALFGTITNVFARTNLLTYATDPLTGERTAIEMRPLSPLVVGLDWRF